MIADPSLLKYNSFAAAEIFGLRAFLSTTFLLLPKALEDILATEESLFEEVLGAAKGPAEDIPAKVDAICPYKNSLYD